MIGQGRDVTRIDVPLDSRAKFGAGYAYDRNDGGGGWRYASLNGLERSQPVLHSSNKTSEHNTFNMPLTPGMVVAVRPVNKFAKQNLKLRSFPVKLPWQA